MTYLYLSYSGQVVGCGGATTMWTQYGSGKLYFFFGMTGATHWLLTSVEKKARSALPGRDILLSFTCFTTEGIFNGHGGVKKRGDGCTERSKSSASCLLLLIHPAPNA